MTMVSNRSSISSSWTTASSSPAMTPLPPLASARTLEDPTRRSIAGTRHLRERTPVVRTHHGVGWSSDEAVLERGRRRRGPGGDLELREDVLQVPADGVLAD